MSAKQLSRSHKAPPCEVLHYANRYTEPVTGMHPPLVFVMFDCHTTQRTRVAFGCFHPNYYPVFPFWKSDGCNAGLNRWRKACRKTLASDLANIFTTRPVLRHFSRYRLCAISSRRLKPFEETRPCSAKQKHHRGPPAAVNQLSRSAFL